jgi:flagellar biosynthetic protein FliQ
LCGLEEGLKMDTAMVVDLARQALWITMIVSAPLLGVALAVGLFIGIIQAATSINEMTLSFIPKLIALGLALLIFGSWQLVTLVDFTRSIFQRIPALFN